MPITLKFSSSSCLYLAESPSSNDEAFNDVFVEDSNIGHCEQCGCLTEVNHHRGPKRFCSTSCARRYSVSCSRKMVAFHARSQGGRHSSANSDHRKLSYSLPMVSSSDFCGQNHSPPIHFVTSLVTKAKVHSK